jgi:hypothetical protein
MASHTKDGTRTDSSHMKALAIVSTSSAERRAE